jgi:hypothetical protein
MSEERFRDKVNEMAEELRKRGDGKAGKRVVTGGFYRAISPHFQLPLITHSLSSHSGEPDSEVYFRYDEQVNPIEKIYVGSGKTEREYVESSGRKRKWTRKGEHDSVTKKANRESTAEVDNKPLTYVKLLGDLCEQTARTFENALYWSLRRHSPTSMGMGFVLHYPSLRSDPSRLSNDKRSPPQYLGRIKDKKSGDWRDATHAEVRGLVCSLFVEKLTQLGLSLAPAATIEEEAGSDEKEEVGERACA